MPEIFKDVYAKGWKNDINTIWILTKQHLLRLIVAIICSILLSSINASIAWFVKPSVDNLVLLKNRDFLIFLPFGILLLFSLKGLFSFANNFLMSSIGAKIVKSLRKKFYEKMLFLPFSFYARESSGSVISRVINDVNVLEGLIANTTKNFFVYSSTVLALGFVALYRNLNLALLSFTVIPLIALVSDRFGRRMKHTSLRTRMLISNVTHNMHETITGIRVIKSFTLEKEMSRRNDQAISEHYRNVMREVRINEFTGTVIDIIAGIGIALLSWYGFYLIVHDMLSLGEFLSFVVAVMMMYDPLKKLSRVNNDFQMIRASLQRIKEIFLTQEEKEGRVEKKELAGEIVFQNVSFQYPDHKDSALEGIDMKIRPGETIAIVGYSGAGKSTLTDLVLGFWNNFTGSITIDGTDLKDYSLRNLRSHIGVVSQDIILFDDTVRNNILFGKPTATNEEIIEAAKAAYAHEFVMNMPNGYDTSIGERGIKLSGGQKQRISLARAIIKNPKILILDEATSSLDTDSETKIQKALEGIMPGRTTIIIAHRLSTIQKADRIVVMDKGKIIQQGSHEELFEKGGVYRELYAMQFGLASH
jgi:subfamily B ATP-binding cassette protein MsbA